LDQLLRSLAATADLEVERIRAISGSAQQHGSVYLRPNAGHTLLHLDPEKPIAGQIAPLFSRSESPVWLDSSTSADCRAIGEALGGDEVARRLTGSPITERFTGPQIRRFARTQPDAYAATGRIHLVSSFLASLLIGGDAPIDHGDGSGMNLMDLANNTWSPLALAATAPRLATKLPPLRPSSYVAGTLSPYWQRRLSLPAASIVTWSGDNPCSLVGTGVIRPGVLAVSLGTSDTVFACARAAGTAASHVFRAPTGDFMNLACFTNGSLAREWVRQAHDLDWDACARLLERTPGNNGYVMLPWVERESTPRVVHAGVRRFAFDALDAARNVRGLIEGQMMAMANHAAAVTTDPIERIIATGGAAANRSILQVMANVFGVDVHRLDVANSAALGAALRAYHAERLAAGEPVTWESVVAGFTDPHPGHRVTPNPKHVAVYAQLRREYAILERLHQDRPPIC
jgi:xylulokinase